MKRILFGILTILTCSLSYGQSFEGKLTYSVEFDIKSQKFGGFEITKEQVIEKMKSNGEFFNKIFVTLKQGNYIKEDNSSSEKRIIYKSDVNKIYTFQKDFEYEVITDADKYNAYNLDFKEPKIEEVDSLKSINGFDCKLLKLSWDKLGEEYYFYNSEIARIDPELFKNHNYEFFNTVVGKTNSYPLEIVKIVSNLISIKMTLVSISEEEISDDLFDIEKIKAKKYSSKQNQKTDWSSFKDDEMGYTIDYPESWVAKGGKGGFMCGLKSGFSNAEFVIWWSEVNNQERIDMLFNDEGLYDGYVTITKPISIDGMDGIYYLRTHKDKPNEYHESIVLKTTSKWYSISNSGFKNKWFEHFYNSFNIIN